MSATTWTGGTSTDITNNANWSNDRPVIGSDVYVSAQATYAMGAGSLTNGNAVVTSLTYDKDYTLDTGTSAADLVVFAGEINLAGSGTVYMQMQDVTTLTIQGGGTNYLLGVSGETMATTVWDYCTGIVNYAYRPAEVGTVAALYKMGTGTLYLGGTVTVLTTVYQKAGTLDSSSAIATFNGYGGVAWQRAAISTMYTGSNHELHYATNGALADFVLQAGAVLDLRDDIRAVTITAGGVAHERSSILDPQGRATWTVGFSMPTGHEIGNMTALELGPGRTYTVVSA